jgi:predicted TIM-barrel fold metal-dependent hydrolase
MASLRDAATTVVDVDVHPVSTPERLAPYLEQRWRDYLDTWGIRSRHEMDFLPALRPGAARDDAFPPSGTPGSDPEFASAQLLDRHRIDLAILTNEMGMFLHAGGNAPTRFCEALERAENDWMKDCWLDVDDRWLAGVATQYESPERAVKELERCLALSDKFVEIIGSTRTERPLGYEKYWPLYEAVAHYDIPFAIHPGGTGTHQTTGSGWPSYYFENHVNYPIGMFTHIASMIFEGVFDRWPSLRVVVLEGGWSWAIPFAWRLDNTWEVQKSEVPHLQCKPSEYLFKHFWFSTQPMEEPSNPKWFGRLFEHMETTGLAGRLMFSSDYPHWDFDDPFQALPTGLTAPTRHAILSDNAVELYSLQDRLAARAPDRAALNPELA